MKNGHLSRIVCACVFDYSPRKYWANLALIWKKRSAFFLFVCVFLVKGEGGVGPGRRLFNATPP